MTTTVRKLRVFIASPSDLTLERDCLSEVVLTLNQDGGAADERALSLELADWRTHAAPVSGRPENAILEDVPVNSWDIFIGLLWHKFGTPPGRADTSPEESFESGTEEEFKRAYQSWQDTGRPIILFYQCIRPVPPDEIDSLQLQKVQSFFAEFSAHAAHPGLYKTFTDLPQFERMVTRDLTKVMSRFDEAADPLPPDLATHEMSIAKCFEPGEVAELVALSIDIVKLSEIKIYLIRAL